MKKRFKIYIRGLLKNGKLHGVAQMFGISSMNPNGRCAKSVEKGLSFIGYFEEGQIVGHCWRQLIGGSWMYGKLNDQSEFTGSKDIAYIYPDLELAMIGHFEKGLITKGQEAKISKVNWNEYGILTLQFSNPSGPCLSYNEQSNVTFDAFPLVQDPLDKKYVYLKKSEKIGGDGVFAKVDIPAETIFATLSGYVYTFDELVIYLKSLSRKFHSMNSTQQEKWAETLWMYRYYSSSFFLVFLCERSEQQFQNIHVLWV